MTQKLKKTSTLFHSTKKYEHLKNILKESGFKASYADEKIESHEVKILMVSFSNVALFEAKSQINYGEYALGLTKEWGIKNELEPVIYTYENSITGNTFMENVHISGTIATLYPHTADCRMLLDNSINNLQYLKQYIVKKRNGKEFIAYNDREWRYVHKHDKYNSLIFKDNFLNGNPNPDYKKHEPFIKPYTNIVLNFDLEDIKFIIIKNKNQKKTIVAILSKRFSKEKVFNQIIN